MTRTAMRHAYARGERYRVTKEGCYLEGLKPIPWGQQGWRSQPLAVGTILTCAGSGMSFGSDGASIIKWLDADGLWIANDCEFQPSKGHFLAPRPDDTCLERVEG